MAVGLGISGEAQQYNGRITWFVVLSSMVAATGGIIFGYDIGISGPFCCVFRKLHFFYTFESFLREYISSAHLIE